MKNFMKLVVLDKIVELAFSSFNFQKKFSNHSIDFKAIDLMQQKNHDFHIID